MPAGTGAVTGQNAGKVSGLARETTTTTAQELHTENVAAAPGGPGTDQSSAGTGQAPLANTAKTPERQATATASPGNKVVGGAPASNTGQETDKVCCCPNN